MNGKKTVRIEISRGASLVRSDVFTLESVKRISLGRGFRDTVRLKDWDFEESISIVQRSANQSFQFVAPKNWGGLLQNGKELVEFPKDGETEHRFLLSDRTVAMIQLDGWTISVRCFVQKSKSPSRPRNNSFSAPLYHLFASTQLEARYLLVGAFIGVFILSSAILGLSRLEFLWNHEAEYKEMFEARKFSPFFLKNSPDLLQKTLDRSQHGESLKEYFEATHNLLAYGKKSSVLSQSTTDLYARQSEDAKFRLEEMIAQNKKISTSSSRHDSVQLSMPVVFGETRFGSINRTLDKIDLLVSANQEIVSSRLSMTNEFSKDASYLGGSSGKANDSSLDDFTEALGAGYRRKLPDVKQQIFEAEQAALFSAKSRQLTLPRQTVSGLRDDFVEIKLGTFPLALSFNYLPDPVSSRLTPQDFKQSLQVKIQKIPLQQRGKLNQELLFKALTYGRDNLQLCFELAAKRHNVKDIQMDWEWRIQPNGLASGIKLLSSSVEDQALIDCIREKVAQIPFPKPDGGPVVVRYPFEYSPSF